MKEITRALLHIYRNCYYLRSELSEWKGSVTHGLGADISLPPCLATGIWNLAPKATSGPKSRGASFGTTLWRHVQRYCAQFLVIMQISLIGFFGAIAIFLGLIRWRNHFCRCFVFFVGTCYLPKDTPRILNVFPKVAWQFFFKYFLHTAPAASTTSCSSIAVIGTAFFTILAHPRSNLDFCALSIIGEELAMFMKIFTTCKRGSQ